MVLSNIGLILCIEQKQADMEYDCFLLLSSHPMLTQDWSGLRIWSKYLKEIQRCLLMEKPHRFYVFHWLDLGQEGGRRCYFNLFLKNKSCLYREAETHSCTFISCILCFRVSIILSSGIWASKSWVHCSLCWCNLAAASVHKVSKGSQSCRVACTARSWSVISSFTEFHLPIYQRMRAFS